MNKKKEIKGIKELINHNDLNSQKKPDVVKRYAMMFVIYKRSGFSLGIIGELFNKNYATVLYGIEKIIIGLQYKYEDVIRAVEKANKLYDIYIENQAIEDVIKALVNKHGVNKIYEILLNFVNE